VNPALDSLRRPADVGDHVAGTSLLPGAAQWAVEQRRTDVLERHPSGLLDLERQRARVDHHGSGLTRCNDLADHVVERFGRGERDDDRCVGETEPCHRLDHCTTQVGEDSAPDRVDVVADDTMARVHQLTRDRSTHDPQADDADRRSHCRAGRSSHVAT